MKYRIVTPPNAEPVSLEEAKLHVRADGDAEDSLIEGIITSAREYCETYTRRALATQTVEAYLDAFPRTEYIELPRPPLQSVVSVVCKDIAGSETTLVENEDYLVDLESSIGSIVLPYGKNWPSVTSYPINPIKIRLTAGYSTGIPIPKMVKQAMLLLIGHWYANREAVLTGSISKELEFSVRTLLTMHRVRW
jgi:uncharacterized phiE125 gp8 family phage protein